MREKAAYDLLTLVLGVAIFGWGVVAIVRRKITLPSKGGWSHTATGTAARVVGTVLVLLGGYFVGAALGRSLSGPAVQRALLLTSGLWTVAATRPHCDSRSQQNFRRWADVAWER